MGPKAPPIAGDRSVLIVEILMVRQDNSHPKLGYRSFLTVRIPFSRKILSHPPLTTEQHAIRLSQFSSQFMGSRRSCLRHDHFSFESEAAAWRSSRSYSSGAVWDSGRFGGRRCCHSWRVREWMVAPIRRRTAAALGILPEPTTATAVAMSMEIRPSSSASPLWGLDRRQDTSRAGRAWSRSVIGRGRSIDSPE